VKFGFAFDIYVVEMLEQATLEALITHQFIIFPPTSIAELLIVFASHAHDRLTIVAFVVKLFPPLTLWAGEACFKDFCYWVSEIIENLILDFTR
jgi:hypothetical protein